jgi:hypothetical protein
MKWMDKFTKKFANKASTAVKSEVKKTALDILPKVLGIAAMILGVVVFKEVVDEPEEIKPIVTNTSITTNNYFFQEVNEDIIRRVLEDK